MLTRCDEDNYGFQLLGSAVWEKSEREREGEEGERQRARESDIEAKRASKQAILYCLSTIATSDALCEPFFYNDRSSRLRV